jgi:hypothetical protein
MLQFCAFAVLLIALTIFFHADTPGRVAIGAVVFAAVMTALSWMLERLLAKHDARRT